MIRTKSSHALGLIRIVLKKHCAPVLLPHMNSAIPLLLGYRNGHESQGPHPSRLATGAFGKQMCPHLLEVPLEGATCTKIYVHPYLLSQARYLAHLSSTSLPGSFKEIFGLISFQWIMLKFIGVFLLLGNSGHSVRLFSNSSISRKRYLKILTLDDRVRQIAHSHPG